MFIYSSPAAIWATGLLSLLALLWVVSGVSPVVTMGNAFAAIFRDSRARYLLPGIGGVLAVNLLQLRLESALRTHAARDFTNVASQFGTDLLLALQRHESVLATHLLTYVYVILFPLLGIVGVFIYAAARDFDSVRRLLAGLLVNYLVALPFYLLVPVKEAWAGDSGVRFLIPSVYPAFEAQYRALSGLNNCFPSLHTSLSLTFALVAWRGGYRRLAAFLTAGAALVVFGTLYLGVHWVPDMLAGVLLSVAAASTVPEQIAHVSLTPAVNRIVLSFTRK